MKKYTFLLFLIIFYALLFCTSFYTGEQYRLSTVENNVPVLSQSIKENNTSNNLAVQVQKEENVDSNLHNTMQGKQLNSKEVFLTFDDGPSQSNTTKILNILNKAGVKATFFVIGKNVQQHPELLKNLYDNGMCIATHTYTHDYKIYKTKEDFFQDNNQCNESIKKVLGFYPIQYIRLPGGSDNKVSNAAVLKDIKETLKQKGISYVDWNIDSGDATKSLVSAEAIKNNLITQLKKYNFAVILMHDAPAKTTTPEALEYIIEELKKSDYTFRTFNDLSTAERNQMINLRIINK